MSKDPLNMLSFILGNDTKSNKNHQPAKQMPLQRVNRQLIINSAMFWDSKKRVQKIKTLFLNNLGLKQFDDTEDFKIEQLQKIQLLSLSKNAIIHLHPLINLTSLISLNVSFNKVYDLNPLTKLEKLQELYASNNEIKSIEVLKQLTNIKILQVYKNKIHNFKETFQTLSHLNILSELDIQENPVSEDKEFVQLISTSFNNLKKVNGQLNKTSQKIKQMNNSKGFMNNTSTKGFGTTSMFFTANSSNLIDPQRTFYDFCKKKGSNSRVWQRKKQKQNIIQKLQNHYNQLDQQFQNEIVKNVRLKNRLYKLIQNKKVMENQKQDNSSKIEEMKQLKRKAKDMKEQLFTKDKKGDLLRKLFQIQTLSSKGQQSKNNQKLSNGSNLQKNNIQQAQRLQKAQNEIRWTRQFEADQVIFIQRNQNKYLEDQDEQINNILGKFQNSIRQIKNQINYLS